VEYDGIMSNGLNLKDATININSYKVSGLNRAISIFKDINITNSNININRFSTGIKGDSTTITSSTLNFDGCAENIKLENRELNVNSSNIYSTNNAPQSSLVSSMGTAINLKDSVIKANDGSLIQGIYAFSLLNIKNSTVDFICQSYGFKGISTMTVDNSTINALSKDDHTLNINNLLDIKDSIINAEGGTNKTAILLGSNKHNEADYKIRITLSGDSYVKNNMKLSKSEVN
ncbi:MAG: hypothetical protein RSE52_08220, partial [Erysipelotrichaceae bacterium]